MCRKKKGKRKYYVRVSVTILNILNICANICREFKKKFISCEKFKYIVIGILYIHYCIFKFFINA